MKQSLREATNSAVQRQMLVACAVSTSTVRGGPSAPILHRLSQVFAGDAVGLAECLRQWPVDVADYLASLSANVAE